MSCNNFGGFNGMKAYFERRLITGIAARVGRLASNFSIVFKMRSLVIFSALCGVAAGNYAFLSIGDWGGAMIDEQTKNNVYAVSAQMQTTATATGAHFIINTGDNFYWCGLQNTSDPQISIDFEQPYAPLQLPWYNALGVSH